jgi:uncharacterized damage-inducible protein DinB
MQPLTVEQANFLLQNILPALKNEYRTTKAVLQAIPADKGDYRPDPCARSAMELARHIVVAENRFLETVLTGVFDVNAAALPATVKTPGDIAAWYAENFERNFEALSKASSEQLSKIVDFRGIFQRPAVFFLQLAMVHSVHHRGQLSTYLRPMGAKVPAIYGESYDTAQAKQAAQTAR